MKWEQRGKQCKSTPEGYSVQATPRKPGWRFAAWAPGWVCLGTWDEAEPAIAACEEHRRGGDEL